MLLGDIHNKRPKMRPCALTMQDALHPGSLWVVELGRGALNRVVLRDGPGWRQQVCDSCRRRSPAVSP